MTLDDAAKAAKAKLVAILKQYEGPREEYFVKQGQAYGGEIGENANGNKTEPNAKKNKKGAASTAPAAKDADPEIARFNERDLNHDGKLSPEEFTATAADKAGFITREEFSKEVGK